MKRFIVVLVKIFILTFCKLSFRTETNKKTETAKF